jgi:hypothetical integral membrane protein (TIGR02206 family)
LLVALVRSRPAAARPVRWALAVALLALVGFELATAAREGWLGWTTMLPLELCDAAMVLTVVTLLRPRRPTAELVYFWSASGSVLAMLTPDLRWSFPRWEFVIFFGLHGLVLASALLLVFGLGLRPRRGAPLRVLGITAGWAAFVALVNFVIGTNFMYLRQKPPVATPLDWMGPWPVYIVAAALVALALFELLAVPFRREWKRARAC